jgi:O-antigen ligase
VALRAAIDILEIEFLTACAPPLQSPARAKPRSETGKLIGLLLAMVVLGGIAYATSPINAGLLYVPIFLFLAATKPRYALFLIFAAAPFAWDVGGGPVKMAVSELSLAMALPLRVVRGLRLGPKRGRVPRGIPIGAYLAVCLVSTALGAGWGGTLSSLLQMIVYLVICVYVFSCCIADASEMNVVFYGLLWGCAGLAVLEIATRSMYVLGLHKNLVGTELMYATIIGFELWMAKTVQRQKRRWDSILLAVLVAGLVLTVSRGAWMGTAVGMLIILLLRRQTKLAVKSLLVVAPIIAIAWFMVPAQTKQYATDFDTDSRFSSAGTRIVSLEYAYGIFKSSPILGVGVGLRKQYDATNVVMSTLAETGVLGLIAFAAIFATLVWMAWKAQRKVGRDDPNFSLMAAGTAVVFGKLLHGCVDHYWSRGIIPVWAGAGLVVFAYNYARRLPAQATVTRSAI